MPELSPDLRRLVLATRATRFASAGNRARILEGLRARLGDAAIMGAGTAQVVATSATPGFAYGKQSAIAIAGLTLLGGILFFTARAQRAFWTDANLEPIAVNVSTITSEFAADSSRIALPPESAASGSPVTVVPSIGDITRAVTSNHAQDRLAAEVALLSRAQGALRNGRPVLALEVLNEHERKFGNGQLREERIAARVQALCALGRTAEARAQLAQLSPNSIHSDLSRQACGSGKGD